MRTHPGLASMLLAAGLTISCISDSKTAPADTRVSTITYALPTVSYKLNASYVLLDCTDQIKIEPKVALVPIIAADAATRREFDAGKISGKGRKQLDLKIELTDIGTLRAINAGVSDRTPSIITNILKTIGTVLGIIAALDTPAHACTPAIRTAVGLVQSAENARMGIAVERNQVLIDAVRPGNPLPAKVVSEKLAALDARLKAIEDNVAALRAKVLTIEHAAEIELKDGTEVYTVSVPDEKIGKWFQNAGSHGAPFKTEFKLTGPGTYQTLPPVNAAVVVFRLPKAVDYELCQTTCSDDNAKRFAKGMLSVPQWGEVRHLDFAAAFAEEKTIGVAFDPVGAVTSLSFKRNARGEAISGAAASISGEMANTIRSVQFAQIDADTAALKKEFDYYDLQNKLKEAREKYLKSLESPPP